MGEFIPESETRDIGQRLACPTPLLGLLQALLLSLPLGNEWLRYVVQSQLGVKAEMVFMKKEEKGTDL